MSASVQASTALLARRELWLLLSAALVDPFHRERFDLLQDASCRRRALQAAAFLEGESAVLELGAGEMAFQSVSLDSLFAALDAGSKEIEAAYRQLFGLTAISERCPACEIEYEPNLDVTFRAQRLADVAGFYRAFGMQLSARAGERLDHITVEAEFLYLLLTKEIVALEKNDREGAEVCRDARLKFFREHVGWWLPAFARLLSRVAPSTYYRELASLIAALSASERESLGLPPFQPFVVPKPSASLPEGSCFDCVKSQHGS